ncbi:MAG: homoserine kinase [Helicobacter sp.]|nr:homoserine kinase [Helicobacter sp.]
MIISTPATSANLGPGFDCLGIALNLRNFFTIKKNKKNENNANDNIFNKIFKEHCDLDFSLSIEANIPSSRGLGSSASVIIAGLGAAHFLKHNNFDKKAILDLALQYEGHPDNISPCVFGGFCISLINNNSIEVLKTQIPSEIRAILVIPNHKVPTDQSRSALPNTYSLSDATFNIAHASFLSACFITQKWDDLKLAAKDKIHQDYRMQSYPLLYEIQNTALTFGALCSTLSGSGSSMLNIAFKDDAELLTKRLKDAFPACKVINTDFDNEGLRLEKP